MKNGNWWRINDNDVKKTEFFELEKESFGGTSASSSAYILVWDQQPIKNLNFDFFFAGNLEQSEAKSAKVNLLRKKVQLVVHLNFAKNGRAKRS